MWKYQLGHVTPLPFAHTHTHTNCCMGHVTPLTLCINTHNNTTAATETSIIQLSVVEMKSLLALLIVVAFTIASSSSNCPPQPGSQCAGTTDNNPATSCKEILQCNCTATNGYYWINTTTRPLQMYCLMYISDVNPGGLMRVANINMNVSNNCSGLTYTTFPRRMCTRSHTGWYGCSSVTIPTHGVPYTRVCGRAQGYQYRYTPAFRGSHYDGDGKGYRYAHLLTPDDTYVSGLSVTYGSPRQHIWTFAAGWSKNHNYKTTNCPCAKYPGLDQPDFVGEKYFCESGNEGRVEHKPRWHLSDPLWDSKRCASGSTCCERGGPWFSTTVTETSDDIEVRMCHYFDNRTENIGIDLLEIYIY